MNKNKLFNSCFILFLTSLFIFFVFFSNNNNNNNFDHNHYDNNHNYDNKNKNNYNLREGIKRRLQKWGTVFSTSIVSDKFPERKCKYEGQPICCSALNNPTQKIVRHPIHEQCITTKVYFPSPYETRQLQIAKELSNITDFDTARKQFINLIESSEQVKSANIWLERVSIRQSGDYVEETDEDREYLSKFQVTRKCPGQIEHIWWEYIEPLSIHARHPHALQCWRRKAKEPLSPTLPRAPIASVDYILLQSNRNILVNFQNVNHTTTHKVFQKDLSPKSLLFDLGTSRFDSSLYWFLCGYEQLGFIFESIFGWEYTLLEPNDFWAHVPERYTSSYHFFNIPVTSNTTDSLSPLRIIQEKTSHSDFVSLKMDIDTPEIEIPIALEILSNTELHSLIDEFFFELHFRCEILMFCGWGNRIPYDFMGMKLNRENALNYFQSLRKVGIRSHIWP